MDEPITPLYVLAAFGIALVLWFFVVLLLAASVPNV